MSYPFSLTQNTHLVEGAPPATDAAGRTGDYVSLKNTHKAFIVVSIAQGNAATVALTPYQATAVAGTSEKVLANAVPIWANQDTATSDLLVRQTDAVNFTTSAALKNKMVIFEIDPAQLDADGGFDCLTIKTGASNAANITSILYVLGGQRYPAAVVNQPSAIID
jgi:hypothetical protein